MRATITTLIILTTLAILLELGISAWIVHMQVAHTQPSIVCISKYEAWNRIHKPRYRIRVVYREPLEFCM